ncbi:MAG: hypothetical protein KGH72_00665 [Candidatus Micrarchaeota archaeon]|nr:hypothetical protein [Candidatus Micrarchaeota archaeon]
MLLRRHYEVTVNKNIKEDDIWKFAWNPKNWTASNPSEHLGLVFYNKQDRPETGATFLQRESLAGIYADLHGQILYAERPKVCVWTGTAAYRFGYFTFYISEGGTLRLVRNKDGIIISHDVFMDFVDSWLGKLAMWYFKTVLKGERALNLHAQRELDYFKKCLEK